MLDRLRCCQQSGIECGRGFVLFNDSGALFDNAENCVAGFSLRLFSIMAKTFPAARRDLPFRLDAFRMPF